MTMYNVQCIAQCTIYYTILVVLGSLYMIILIYQAVGWSNEMERWVFLPRRMSNER